MIVYDLSSKDANELMEHVTAWQAAGCKRKSDASKALAKLADKITKDSIIIPHLGLHPPKVGDYIYLRSSFYIDHGQDDFCGGLAEVTRVEDGISAGKTVAMISCKEKPGSRMNWEYLKGEQEKLAAQYGAKRAHPCPDYG
jgi:hypothetical protein